MDEATEEDLPEDGRESPPTGHPWGPSEGAPGLVPRSEGAKQLLSGLPFAVRTALVAAVALLVLWSGATVYLHLNPYYAISPGDALPVTRLIHVASGHSYPTSKPLLMTDVLLGPVSAIQLPIDLVDSQVDLVPAAQVLGPGGTAKQLQKQGTEEMFQSQEFAIRLALDHLPAVPILGSGALVVAYPSGSPAQKWVRPDDVIVAVDGQKVSGPDQLRTVVGRYKPGDRVTLTIDNAVRGTQRRVDTTLISGVKGKPLIGIEVSRNPVEVHRLPFSVSIKANGIGGPSAGLSFALGIIDELSPGNLTGGLKVAATGEVDPSGDVLPIGGLPQKTVAVRDAGARVFFVPYGQSKSDYARAKQFAGGKVTIVKVHSITDALGYLAGHGGDLSDVSVTPVS